MKPQLLTGLLWKMGLEFLPKEAFAINRVDTSRVLGTAPGIHGSYRDVGLLERLLDSREKINK